MTHEAAKEQKSGPVKSAQPAAHTGVFGATRQSPFAAAGNQAVQGLLIQAGLRRSAASGPIDPAEEQAERHADELAARMAGGAGHTLCPACASGKGLCPTCAIRRKARGPAPKQPPREIRNAFNSGGQPLPTAQREMFERKVGADLSGVRIHTDRHASQAAESLNAQAFAFGTNIAFARGMFQPDTSSGLRLLAHEVAHTLQDGSTGQVRRQAADKPPDKPKAPPDPNTLAKIKKINAKWWVGPLDEYDLEDLWDSYDGSLPDVYNTAEGKKEWETSIDKGAELWKIKSLAPFRDEFKAAIANTARGYLKDNRDLAQKEKDAIGPDANTPPTPEQTAALNERREAADRIKAARRAEAALRMLPVGYDRVPGRYALFKSECHPIANESGNKDLAVKPFHPLIKPQIDPRGDEPPCGKMPTWTQTKEMWERLEGVIDGMTAKYPSLYALARDLDEEKVATSEGKGANDSRVLMLKALNELIANIDKTEPKLNTDFVLELKPIHTTLMGAPPWNAGFKGMVAAEMLKGHENDEFWHSIGLATLAAALFIVASLATGGLAAVLFGASIGISAGVAANSIDRALQLRTAQRTSLSKGTEIVSSGQVTGAIVTAVLDTVFVFLDAFSAAKALGSGAKAAAGMGERVLPKTLKEAEEAEAKLAEKTLSDVAAKDADQIGKQLGAGGAREVTDESLKKAGYVLEVEITEGAEKHIYRRLKDGTWCRWSVKICGIKLPENVEQLAAKAAEKIEDPAAAALRETLESAASKAATKLAPSRIAEILGNLAKKFPIVKSLPDGAIERVVRAAYAEAEGGGLRKAARALSRARGQLLEELANARIAEMIKSPAGKARLGLGHITEELIYIDGSRITDAAGQQITDGIIAIQRKDAIQIVAVVESKAGEFAAGKLATSFNTLRRASADTIAETLRHVATETTGKASGGIMARLRNIDAKLADAIVAHQPVDKKQLLAALEQLGDADLAALKKGMGTGEGQIAKDLERLMEEARQKGLKIDSKDVKVAGEGRPSFVGVAPKDVPVKPIGDQLAKEGYQFSFLDFGNDALTVNQLNELAGDLVKALGPDLEAASQAAKP